LKGCRLTNNIMETRRISAHYIIPGHTASLKYGIVEFSSDGTILQLTDTGGEFRETAGLEFYSGIITPGFIISPFLKDLAEMSNETPEFPYLDEFLSWVGSIMKVRIADDPAESLKILKYMLIIQERNPSMSLSELISRLTWLAACSLGIQNELGSLQPGRKPGINLLTHLDMPNMKLTEETKIMVIM